MRTQPIFEENLKPAPAMCKPSSAKVKLRPADLKLMPAKVKLTPAKVELMPARMNPAVIRFTLTTAGLRQAVEID